MKDTQELFKERSQRIKDVVALKKPDRVPFAPKIGNYYARGYGISMYDAMIDIRNIIPGVEGFLDDFEPDLAWAPVMYPIEPMEAMDCQYVKWPGATHNLPLNDSFQLLDKCFLEDDEYDEFLLDPTHFFITKVYPRKFKDLEPLSKICFRNPVEYSLYAEMATFAQPDVKAALDALKRGGEASAKWLGYMGSITQLIVSKGFPLGAATAQTCPFDMFSDNIRGFVNTVTDIYQRPEKLLAALDYMTEVCIERATTSAKALGVDYVFIPLHAGMDEFMSPANYEKFYWSGLKKLMMALIEIGITPYVFCEGKYNTRLEVISDVPKGKVIYMFEEVDIVQAKKTVGQVACICGNLPTALLVHGKKERVVEETKRLIDNCAGDGGFIMDCSIVLDNAKRENMEAWAETTRLYGKY
ncbi:uroporphyrinogen decarboxylase family protein [Desulfitibacter alkalitolerans]|uniref:uroporphyrinogen decarboxylase family protein n=1 Tax=Desulfitibacter alkalitolerans TaxID=264641 RepID=UPI000486B98D|nr:uroporphyrinogen decarboxylase family protein [Desulfitibacter alkalitolerans]